jgi:GNAT superfamily N-acetyltransferase
MILILPTIPASIPTLQDIERAGEARFEGLGLFKENGPLPLEVYDDHAQAIAAGLSFCAHDAAAPGQPVVGYIVGRQQDATTAYLEQIDVLESHGQRGIGAALVAKFCGAAAAGGANTIVLSTFRDIPWNGPFYAKLGFEEIAPEALTPWMRDIENAQRTFLDISRRCFMRKSLAA